MDKRRPPPTDDERLHLRRHIEKIRKLCSAVLEGYTQHCEEIYGHPATQHSLNKIQLLYEERIQRRCAEYNLSMAEEMWWEPSQKIAHDNKDDSSGEESEEHDSDVVNIYTTSDDSDDDSSDDDDNSIEDPDPYLATLREEVKQQAKKNKQDRQANNSKHQKTL